MKTSKLLLVLVGCGLTAASLSAQTAARTSIPAAKPARPAIATPAVRVTPTPEPTFRGDIVVTPTRPVRVTPRDDDRRRDRPNHDRIEAARIKAARLKAARIQQAREDAARDEERRPARPAGR
jgi:hypothetical protein